MEKIDWMLGMTENMMNKTMDNPAMKELYAMTSTMMGNLNHMKMMPDKMEMSKMNMMEMMMRNMEEMMMGIDMDNMVQMKMMKNMMQYMVMMQMSMLMEMMN